MAKHRSGDNNYDTRNPGTENLYTPPQCQGNSHVGAVSEYGRDASKGIKHMTCQACGSNWDEAI
jgi:hypothetical protein